MKKNKGFTLIELLAVIVILAIIALIAVPQVIKILNKSRLSSAEDSVYGIVKSGETYVADFMLKNKGELASIDLEFDCDSEGCNLTTELEGYELTGLESLNFKGTKPESGKVVVKSDGKVIATDIVINGFTCNYSNEDGKVSCKGSNEEVEEPFILSCDEHIYDKGTITVEQYNEVCKDYIDESIYKYTNNSDGTISITGFKDEIDPSNIIKEVWALPATIEEKSVTSINIDAFYNKKISSKLIIPSSVTSIGKEAFRDNQLTNVEIPNSVTIIGNDAFRNNQLTSIEIPDSVTRIGDYAFSYNQLTSVKIGKSVTSIGERAFYENQLTSLEIPNSVTSIGSTAFAGNQLTSVEIPNSVTSIGEYVFFNNQLTSVKIGNSVTSIGNNAFKNNQLTSVEIPDSVISIGDYAFSYNQLTGVEIGNSVTSIGKSSFYKGVLRVSGINYDSNKELTKIINKTGKEFDWGIIVNDSSGYNFITGNIENKYGNVEVVAE